MFYAAQYRQVVGLLIALGANRTDAEEITQESFIKALHHWRRVSAYDNPAAWIRLIAVRAMTSDLRKQSRRREIEADLRPVVPREPHVDPIEIKEAIHALPLTHRQVVVLHYTADMSVADIAHLLKIPLGTVQSRLSRARDHLTQLLNAEENENA